MKRGIKYHVMARLAVILLTVLFSLSILSYMMIYQTLQNNISQKGIETSQRVSGQINGALEDVFRLASSLSLNRDIQSFVQKTDYVSPSERVISVSRLMEEIKRNFVINKYIHSFCIVDAKGNYYWSVCPYDDFFKDWFAIHTLKGKSLEESVGFTSESFFASKPMESAALVSFVTDITQVKNGPLTTMGQVIINLNIGVLFQDIQNGGGFSQIGVLAGDNHILYHYGGETTEFLKTAKLVSKEGTVQKIGDYYIKSSIPLSGWQLYLSFDRGQINQTIDVPFLQIVLWVALCTMLLLFLLIFPFLAKISTQIVRLDRAMSQVARGNWETCVSLSGSRELESISAGFNEMVVKIKRIMKKALENERAKQQASSELLLAKINPHFIYNTLDSVIYLARKQKSAEIIELTSAFIYLLQDGIHLGKNSLYERLGTEVEVVKKYVTIQKIRYADRFQFLLDWDPELRETRLPKNILQPFVENAIIHGTGSKEGRETIRMSLKREGDSLRILIRDDGVGMEQEKADRLLSTPSASVIGRDAGELRSIGIRNIAEKLQFVYPGRHTFRIVSRPGEGTTVRIVIPLYRRENLPE